MLEARTEHVLVALLGLRPHSLACWDVKPFRNSMLVLHPKAALGIFELGQNWVRDAILGVWVVFRYGVALSLVAGAHF